MLFPSPRVAWESRFCGVGGGRWVRGSKAQWRQHVGVPWASRHFFITEGGGRVLLLLIPQYQEVPGKDNVAAVSSSSEAGVEVPWLNNII